MPAGGVRLGAINVAGFVNPFEACHAVFLVELRALREVSGPLEIPDLEKIGAAFGPSAHDFGRDDLGESPAVERFAKESKNGSLNPKDIADTFRPKAQRPVFNEGLHADTPDVRRRLKRKIMRRSVENGNFGDFNFVTAARAGVAAYGAMNLDGIFDLQVKIPQDFRSRYALSLSGAIAKNDESRF